MIKSQAREDKSDDIQNRQGMGKGRQPPLPPHPEHQGQAVASICFPRTGTWEELGPSFLQFCPLGRVSNH